jgi:hypothetical protein
MNLKKVKKYIPASNIKNGVDLTAAFDAVKAKFITRTGSMTELGYKMYLSLLAITGKNSVYNAPIRKTYVWIFTIDELKKYEVIKYNEVKYEYNLTDKGERLIYILSRALNNKGIPKI